MGKAKGKEKDRESGTPVDDDNLPEIDGIKVYCAYRDLTDLERLIPNPRNPNTHPSSQIALLAKIIKAQGWRTPITVSKRSGYIVRGHGRYMAAQLLGLSKAPVDYQDYENEATEWADLIADNRIAELAEMDSTKLREALLELDTGAFDMDLTGFDDAALADLMTAAPPGEFSGDKPPPLPPPDAEGEDTRSGRFILVYLTPEERAQWVKLLGLSEGTTQVVITTADCPALGGTEQSFFGGGGDSDNSGAEE